MRRLVPQVSVFVLFLIGLATPFANAGILDLDFTSDGSGDAAPFTGINPPIGAAPGFTEFVVAELGPSNNVTSDPSLTTGGITFSITGNVSAWPGSVNGGNDLLQSDYLFIADGLGADGLVDWSVSGLTPNSDYTFTFYHGINFGGRFVDFDSQGKSLQLSGAANNTGKLLLTSDGSGTISGIAANGLGSAEGNWAGLSVDPFPAPIYLDVNSTTGEVVLKTISAFSGNVISYDITSSTEVGALDPSGWTSIANNYDADSGPTGGVQVDPDDNWVEFTPSSTSIAEGEIDQPAGDGAQFGASLSMSLGNIWVPNPFGDDLGMTLLLDDESQVNVPVIYDGSEISNPITIVGDYDGSGQIDAADWPTVRDNFNADMTGLSRVEGYALGDLNGDGVNDILDFDFFEAAFDAIQGQGAFQAMVSAVPEPSSLMLLSLALVATCSKRGRSACLKKSLPCNRVFNVALALFLAIVSGSVARADTFRLDFDGNSLGNGIGATQSGYTGVDYSVGTVSLGGFGSLDMSQVDGAWDAHAGIGLAVTPTDDLNLDYLFENTGDASTLSITGVNPGNFVSVSVYTSFFRDSNFTYDGNTTYLPTSTSGNIIQNVTGQSSYSFTFSAGTHPTNEGNVGGIDITIDSVEVEPEFLTLQIDRDTGTASLLNKSDAELNADFYRIESTTGALDNSWTGLAGGGQLPSGNGSGNGWEQLGNPSDSLLGEAFLQGGSDFGASSGPFNLGSVYSGSSQADEDGLSFTYRDETGIRHLGFVEFVGGQAGDFDGDSDVDGADFLAWQQGYPGTFGAGDLDSWEGAFGTGVGSGIADVSTVPEPMGLTLTLVAALALAAGSRPRGRHSRR